MKKLTRILLLTVTLLCASSAVSAQDIIVLNNGLAEELEVKIQEVAKKDVKYKKWSDPEGALYSVRKKDIFVIKYENGEKLSYADLNHKKVSKKMIKKQKKAAMKAAKKAARKGRIPEKQISEASQPAMAAAPAAENAAPAAESATQQVATAGTSVQSAEPAESKPALTSEKTKYSIPERIKKGTSAGGVEFAYYFPEKKIENGSAYAFSAAMTYGTYLLANGLFAEAGLMFYEGGTKVKSDNFKFEDESDSLLVPIRIGYTLALGENCALEIATGPRLGVVVAGHQNNNGERVKYKDIDGISRFSAVWDFNGGLRIYGIVIYSGYAANLRSKGGVVPLGVRFRF